MRSADISRCSSSGPVTVVPSRATIRSSGRTPAFAAGLPATTSTTSRAEPGPATARARGGIGRLPPAMPTYARRTRPSPMRAATMPRVASFTGTARPRPTPATAVLTPTTRPTAVDQRAAGVARIERGVRLDDVVDQPPGPARPRGQGAPQGRDDACRDRAGEAVRVADGHYQLSHAQARGVAELGHRRGGLVGPKDGQVGEGIGADHAEAQLTAVHEGGLASFRVPPRRGPR